MNSCIIKGNFICSRDIQTIHIRPDAFLVCENGICSGIYDELPSCYSSLPLTDFGDRIIIPGLTDLHIHAPQFAFRGLGMDMELLDWLNAFPFPEESRYADLEYADRAYSQFADHMRRSMTTRAVIFSTIHVASTELLMKKMEQSGLISYVGKVNMDRNCPASLCESSAEASLSDTVQWLDETLGRFSRTKPIITPRFIPSCSDELMYGLRKVIEKYNLPVQSHLSENLSEISWVRRLCPDSEFYGDAYNRFGLFGGDHPCIMAHCVYSSDEEMELMHRNGVYAAHSPMSNANLASGVAPVSKYLEAGLKVGLATDMSGGNTENLFRVMTDAIRDSKLRWRLLDQNTKPLTVEQVFYLASIGGGSFFGKVGSFENGFEFDAVVLDDASLEHPQELSLRERFERCLYLADERNIAAKYVAGNRIV